MDIRGREELQTRLSQDTGDFWTEFSVPRIERCSSLTFAKDVYAGYHPAILTGLIDHWPALSKWSRDYLADKGGHKRISVNLTPDGLADSVKPCIWPPAASQPSDGAATATGARDHFVYPAEVGMTLRDFFALLDRSKLPHDEDQDGCQVVPYLSQQNDNLRTQFPELLEDIEESIALGRDIFSNPVPEAVNLWIGDERSISSIHKDHFENLYAVISGQKTFTLLPPTDILFLDEREYPTLRYECASDFSLQNPRLQLTAEGCSSPSLSWIALDPNSETASQRHPPFRLAHPIQCTVNAGEVLYIPAMWYHRVSQTCTTVAVNYWYDQRFDFRYVFFKTVADFRSQAPAAAAADEVDEKS